MTDRGYINHRSCEGWDDEWSPASYLLEVMARLREPWMAEGACKGLADLMFPERGEDTSQAKAVCAACPVVGECREYGLTLPYDLPGVWGGLSQRERRMAKTGRAA